ncbi:MAG: SDR family oxidoreductase, partial [Sulfurovum sp.]
MPRVLITGSKGQLGSELQTLSHNYDYTCFFADRDTLDITNAANIRQYLQTHQIDTIINCAAYTAVDKAETEQDLANAINHLAVKTLTQIAKAQNIKLIHISTDYVFDGQNFKPYTEEDPTEPQGVYGNTK